MAQLTCDLKAVSLQNPSTWLSPRMGWLRRTCLDSSFQASLAESPSWLLHISSSCTCVSCLIYGPITWKHRWFMYWLASAGRGKGLKLQEEVQTPPLFPFMASSLTSPWHFSQTKNPFLSWRGTLVPNTNNPNKLSSHLLGVGGGWSCAPCPWFNTLKFHH